MTNLSNAVPDEDVAAWADEGECRNCGKTPPNEHVYLDLRNAQPGESALLLPDFMVICDSAWSLDDEQCYQPITDEDRKDAADEARFEAQRTGG